MTNKDCILLAEKLYNQIDGCGSGNELVVHLMTALDKIVPEFDAASFLEVIGRNLPMDDSDTYTAPTPNLKLRKVISEYTGRALEDQWKWADPEYLL